MKRNWTVDYGTRMAALVLNDHDIILNTKRSMQSLAKEKNSHDAPFPLRRHTLYYPSSARIIPSSMLSPSSPSQPSIVRILFESLDVCFGSRRLRCVSRFLQSPELAHDTFGKYQSLV